MQQLEINPWGELTPRSALRPGGDAKRYQPARGAQAMPGVVMLRGFIVQGLGTRWDPRSRTPPGSLHSSRAMWKRGEPHLTCRGLSWSPSPPAPRGRRALPGPCGGLGHGQDRGSHRRSAGESCFRPPLLRRGSPSPGCEPCRPPGTENPPGPGCEPPAAPTRESSLAPGSIPPPPAAAPATREGAGPFLPLHPLCTCPGGRGRFPARPRRVPPPHRLNGPGGEVHRPLRPAVRPGTAADIDTAADAATVTAVVTDTAAPAQAGS